MITFTKQTGKKNLILFVHGFTGSLDTWKHPDHPSFPDLLASDTIISAEYDIACFEYHTVLSAILNHAKNTFKAVVAVVLRRSKGPLKQLIGVDEIAALLRTQLRNTLRDYKNVCIVAHSMGGLVTKAFLVRDLEENLQSKVGLFISLAVPHQGATLATYGQLFSPNIQIQNLAPLNQIITEINDAWLKAPIRPNTRYFYGAHDIIVPKTSAIPPDKEHIDITALNEDHLSIAKPQGASSDTYIAIRNAINDYKASIPKSLEHQYLKDNSQYNNELFVLKLIIADIQQASVTDAKELFLNAEYMRKVLSSDLDKAKIEHLYERVRTLYKDSYTRFLHDGFANSGLLLVDVHEKIVAQDKELLHCLATEVNVVHKKGILHQLANASSGDIWWTRETGLEYLEEQMKGKK